MCVCMCVWEALRRFSFLLLHHATFTVHGNGYCGLWGLDGWHNQRSLHGQHTLRRQGWGDLLNISCSGEPVGRQWSNNQALCLRKYYSRYKKRQTFSLTLLHEAPLIGVKSAPGWQQSPAKLKSSARRGMSAGRWKLLLLLLFRAWNSAISSSQPSTGWTNQKEKK